MLAASVADWVAVFVLSPHEAKTRAIALIMREKFFIVFSKKVGKITSTKSNLSGFQ